MSNHLDALVAPTGFPQPVLTGSHRYLKGKIMCQVIAIDRLPDHPINVGKGHHPINVGKGHHR